MFRENLRALILASVGIAWRGLARSGQAEPCEAPQQGGMGWGGALRGEAGEGGLKCYGRVSHC